MNGPPDGFEQNGPPDGYDEQPQTLKDKALSMIQPFKRAGMPFLQGAISGASLDSIPDQAPLNEPKLESTARTAGSMVGGMLPIGVISALTGGAGAAMGAGPVAAPIISSALGGATYGAIKGAVNQESVPEIAKDTAIQGLLWGGLGTAAEGLGYLRQVFGNYLPEKLANFFIGTPSRVAQDLLEKGKPSLGAQYLETDLPGFKSEKQVFHLANQEANNLRGQILDILSTNPKAQIPSIPLSDITKEGDQLLTNYEGTFGTADPRVRRIRMELQRFSSNKPEMLTPQQAFAIRQTLDYDLGDANLSRNQALPVAPEVDKRMADALRQKIAEALPDAAGLLQKQHLMLAIKDSIKPEAADTGLRNYAGGIVRPFIKGAAESAPANLTADILHTTMGQPLPEGVRTPIRLGVRSLLSDEVQNELSKRKQNK